MKLFDCLSAFDPLKALTVSKQDLAKIVSGKIKNPNKGVDYAFFVAATDKLTEPRRVDSMDNAVDFFYDCSWFGKFYCERDSRIVIPYSEVICFDPTNKLVVRENVKGNVWSGGGYFQLDKEFWDIVLPSKVSVDEMRSVLNRAFPR